MSHDVLKMRLSRSLIVFLYTTLVNLNFTSSLRAEYKPVRQVGMSDFQEVLENHGFERITRNHPVYGGWFAGCWIYMTPSSVIENPIALTVALSIAPHTIICPYADENKESKAIYPTDGVETVEFIFLNYGIISEGDQLGYATYSSLYEADDGFVPMEKLKKVRSYYLANRFNFFDGDNFGEEFITENLGRLVLGDGQTDEDGCIERNTELTPLGYVNFVICNRIYWYNF